MPDRMTGPVAEFSPACEGFRNRLRPGVIETHAVDNRRVGNGSENSGQGVARLRMPGDAPSS